MMFSRSFQRNALRLCKSRWMSSQANLTLVKEENGVRWITLNNPKKRNALSLLMLEKLKQDIFRDVNNIGLRCIILNSSSSIFSSGHDLKELKSSSQDVQDEIFQKCTELMIGIQKVPLPVIAQVKGLAAAAGCQLIASCDMVIATENAQFSTPGAAVGLFCSTPGIAITRAVPRKVASYMLFTGNNITAQEAFQSGLISKIVPEEKLEEVTADVVQAIIKKSRSVLALGKEFFYQQVQEDIETAYRLGAKVMVQNLAIRDAHKGISAFFEKRIPEWQHTLDKPS